MDPRLHELATENELAVVLSHYSSDYIFMVVDDAIKKSKSTATIITNPPNVVSAWETNFRAIRNEYGSEVAAQIEEVRTRTYQEIINLICQAYNLNFTIDDIDLFSAAYFLYDFYVCNISNYITYFFAKYIYKERIGIYDSMGLSELKKNKDSGTLFGKRFYRDIRLAIINANITKVIEFTANSIEFDFNSFITMVVEQKESFRYMMQLVSDNGNIFEDHLKGMLYADLANYITNIRFKLQEIAVSHDQIIPKSEIGSVTIEEDDDNV